MKFFRYGLLGTNTAWVLAGSAVRFFVQAAYFLIIADLLGPRGFGTFAAVAAMVSVLSPFASAGSGDIMISIVAQRKGDFGRAWGNCLLITLSGGILLTGIVFGANQLVLSGSAPSTMVFLIAVSDLIFTPLVDLSGQAFQAHEKLAFNSGLNVLFAGTRLAAAAWLLSRGHTAGATQWAGLYLLGSVASALVGVSLVHGRLGRPRPNLADLRGVLSRGFHFSLGSSAQNIYGDADKTLLARLATAEAAGVYAAGYRVVNVAFAPVAAVLTAAYAPFFASGGPGISGSLRFAKSLMGPAVCYGIAAFAILFFGAGYLPDVIGADFAHSVGVVRWLSVVPLLRTLEFFAGYTLAVSGHQGIRGIVQLSMAAFNVLANLILIPAYSFRAAIWTTLGCEGVLVVALWAAVLRRTRLREKGRPEPQEGRAQTDTP